MMTLNMWKIIMIMFIIGNMIIGSKHKHLLIVSLSLEFVVLSFFYSYIFKFYNK